MTLDTMRGAEARHRILPGIVLLLTTLLSGPAMADSTIHPALWPAVRSQGLVTPEREARIDALMARMSLEEKVGQTIQADIAHIRPEDLRVRPLGSILAGGDSPPLGSPDRAPPAAWLATARAFHAAAEAPRPGHEPIPLLFGIDAVHGHNNVVGATLFPHNIGLGAAGDPELVRRIAAATAEEVAATGIDWVFAPTLAVPRDDRWGRTYEGYGEDPALVARYAAAAVQGLQGAAGTSSGTVAGRVAASAKHFLADGGTTGGVDQGDADLEEGELIRLHAAGYPPAIEAGVMSIMVSFSSWRGQKMSGNTALLTGVLKGRMGFDGIVVSDWNAHAQLPGCTPDSCPAAYRAGLDMIMAPESWRALFDNTVAKVKAGEIPLDRLDDAVRRILRVKLALGLFDAARPTEGRLDRIGAPEHRALAREAARKSLVLLKNENATLPLRGGAHVLVAGAAADDIGRQSGGWTLSWQGTGNSNADFPGAQSIYAGLAAALAAQGGAAELSPDGRFTRRPDAAIVVFGETPYAEFQGDRRHLGYQLDDATDLALLRRLRDQGIPVVAVFLSGRPLWVNREINAADAFVAAWLPGSEGGAIADLLVGDRDGRPRHDFQGRLSFSWPRRPDQPPLNAGDGHYDPLFPLGYGLSYTRAAHVPLLPEETGTIRSGETEIFARGRLAAPWRLRLRGRTAVATVPGDGSTTVLPGLLRQDPVDAEGVQGAGRRFVWRGEAALEIAPDGPAPDDVQRKGNAVLTLRLRLDRPSTGPLRLSWGGAALDIAPLIGETGRWITIAVPARCLGPQDGEGAAPISLTAAGPLSLTVTRIALVDEATDTSCPR